MYQEFNARVQPLYCSFNILFSDVAVVVVEFLNSLLCGTCGGFMVSALVSGSSVPGSSPGRGPCVLLGHDTLHSQCLSPPRWINGYRRI